MKLASAIEEFIQYKRALGNLYIGPANVLKAFLRKTGDLDLDALTSGHCEAFLPAKGGEVTNFRFKKYQALDCLFRFSTSRGYMKHRILPTSMPDRPPRFIPYIYSTEDIRRLLGVPDSHYPRTCPLSPDTSKVAAPKTAHRPAQSSQPDVRPGGAPVRPRYPCRLQRDRGPHPNRAAGEPCGLA